MKLKSMLLAAVAALFVASSASAIYYDVNANGTQFGPFSGNTPTSINGALEIYKNDYGTPSTESGSVGSFTTTYSGDTLTATIDIDAGMWDLMYLAIKVANNYVYWSLDGWDPSVYTGLVVTNSGLITNRQGNSQAISHVSLYGELTEVPDSGATLALLGLGLAAIGYASRRRK